MSDYLYVLQDGEHYKIGVASNVRMRLSQLQTGNPRQIRIETCYRFNDATSIERAFHQRFSVQRAYGEWFALTDADLVVLCKVCEWLGGIPQPEMAHQTASSNEVDEANEDLDHLEPVTQEENSARGRRRREGQRMAALEQIDLSDIDLSGLRELTGRSRPSWRIETFKRGRFWQWRTGSRANCRSVYGGSTYNLKRRPMPQPIDVPQSEQVTVIPEEVGVE